MSKRRYPLTFSELSFRGLGYELLFVFGLLCVIPFYLIAISSFADESSLIRRLSADSGAFFAGCL